MLLKDLLVTYMEVILHFLQSTSFLDIYMNTS